MSASTSDQDSHKALGIWEANATHWDEVVGHEGNHYWKKLQRPCLERLLARQLEPTDEPRRALELACGNGLCSRWLAGHGDAIGEVWATDGSLSMLDRARAYGSSGGRIVFRKMDVTKPEDFTELLEEAVAEAGFDIVLMNMALMDVSDLEPLAAALPKLLRRDGVFVATVLHPVFMTSDYSRDLRYRFDAETGEQTLECGKTIFGYMDVPPVKSAIFSGHKTPFVSFHRPIHELLGPFFRAGLVMDALEEPSFGPEDANPERPHSTVNFPQLPPHMAFRLRRGGVRT